MVLMGWPGELNVNTTSAGAIPCHSSYLHLVKGSHLTEGQHRVPAARLSQHNTAPQGDASLNLLPGHTS